MTTESPDVYLLSQVPWQFFLTLTYRSEKLADKVKRERFFALHYQVAKWAKVGFGELLWVKRAELGGLTARFHLHSLLGGLPEWMVTRRTCFAIANVWNGALACGFAKVYVYDQSRNGLDYIFKGLNSTREADRARQYESQKFGDASSAVEFSRSVSRLLLKRRRLRAGAHGEGHSNTLRRAA